MTTFQPGPESEAPRTVPESSEARLLRMALNVGSEPPSPRRTPSVQDILRRHQAAPITSGALVEELLKSHPDYTASEVTSPDVAALGPVRTAAGHVEAAEQRWDSQQIARTSGRHLVLALAMDPDVGWPLLRSGVIHSILTRWRPESGTPEEPRRLAWDVLSQPGRMLAEEQPLLAAALGVPAEWSAEFPAPVTMLALSPTAGRVAALAGGVVYETGPDAVPRRVSDVDNDVVSLGWGHDGVVALRIVNGNAEVIQVATSAVRETVTDVTGGRLGAGGLPLWLEQSHGVVRSWPAGQPQSTVMAPPGAVLAVDGTGRRGLVDVAGQATLVSSLSEDEKLAVPPDALPNWPSGVAWVIGQDDRQDGPYALLAPGSRAAVAHAPGSGGVVIGEPSSPPAARLATGTGVITALAADAAGHTLAVAIGPRVSVWPLGQGRPAARGVPGYDSDATAGTDLLDADRDALALAALIASRELRPPLAIGLFGDWGSGKTFVLDRIATQLHDLTGETAPYGYLKDVTLVRFNAWHYAETNLWASLVDQVISKMKIEPQPSAPVLAEVTEADQLAEAAAAEVTRIDGELETAKSAVAQAEQRFVRQRRTAWALGTGVLLLAGGVALLAALGGSGRVVAVASIAAALFGSVATAAVQFKRASGQAAEIVDAGRGGLTALSRVSGRPAEAAARAAAANQERLTQAKKAAEAVAKQRRAQAWEVRERAATDVVGTVLGHLSTVTEYREQLSLVARTRDRFEELNRAIQTGATEPKRFVITIDDLDRCAAENVVKVLEAVHLLFSFEMFVVVLAVDTRWLAQSLQMRYPQLLGQPDSAAPSDYLEKIIQVPVHLMPLDEALVRTMITGLTGAPAPLAAASAPGAVAPASAAGAAGPAAGPDADSSPVAEHPRTARPPLPAHVLQITPDEATALAAVAPLVGSTPRTVKRFVNTYRLLKARALDPAEFDHPQGAIGDHEVVAFLLAVVTGRPAAYRCLVPALECAPDGATLQSVAAGLVPAGAAESALADVHNWLAGYPRYAWAPAHRFATWATEVARFSFTPAAASGPANQR
jgi:hypothetical protein